MSELEQIRLKIAQQVGSLHCYDGEGNDSSIGNALGYHVGSGYPDKIANVCIEILEPVLAARETQASAKGATEAQREELNSLIDAVGPLIKGETWKQWAWRVKDYIEERKVALDNDGEKGQ